MENEDVLEQPLKVNIPLIIFGAITLILIIVSLSFIGIITGSVIGSSNASYHSLLFVFILLFIFVVVEIFFFIKYKKKKLNIKELIEEQRNL